MVRSAKRKVHLVRGGRLCEAAMADVNAVVELYRRMVNGEW